MVLDCGRSVLLDGCVEIVCWDVIGVALHCVNGE